MTEDLITNKKENAPLLRSVSKEAILFGVTGVLVLVVLFQSFQLQQLKGYAQGLIEVKSARASVAPAQANTRSARPSNGGLPAQVGGC